MGKDIDQLFREADFCEGHDHKERLYQLLFQRASGMESLNANPPELSLAEPETAPSALVRYFPDMRVDDETLDQAAGGADTVSQMLPLPGVDGTE
ncbi:MAG: hypothetical protein IJT34_02815 [Butyrivibrio sp.]|nr:hypothetical protein [Butyrivibrio sp.]